MDKHFKSFAICITTIIVILINQVNADELVELEEEFFKIFGGTNESEGANITTLSENEIYRVADKAKAGACAQDKIQHRSGVGFMKVRIMKRTEFLKPREMREDDKAQLMTQWIVCTPHESKKIRLYFRKESDDSKRVFVMTRHNKNWPPHFLKVEDSVILD